MMGGRTIEERILEMRFENDQFESGIRQSVNSLEMLRQALRMDDIGDSLSNIETQFGNVDLTGIANDLDQIAYRTSAWGIVAENVISNITNAATQMVSNIGSKVKSLISTGGLTRAMNIEKAQFQLEGLGVAWDQISADIDYAVKGTRYGLDEAAVAASQLVASNVEIGDSMKTALRGISGVAAMTNREYGDISQIFTTVASNGKLMTMQLRQLSASGLNASAALAKQLGKTEQQVNEMVSKGEIDFATFAKAMDDAFGEHATRANETFTGAFANMKAAFARIGEKFWTPLMKGARDVLNTFTPLVDAVKNGLAPAFELLNGIVSVATIKITSFLGGISTDELTKKIENLTGRFKAFIQSVSLDALNDKTDIGRTVNGIAAAFELLKKAASGVAGFIKQIVVALSPLGQGLLKVTAWFGDLLVALNEATGAGGAVATIFQKIADTVVSFVTVIGLGFKGITDVIDDFANNIGVEQLTNPIAKFVDRFEPAQKAVNALKVALAGLGHAAESIKPALDTLGNGIKKVFDTIGAFIKSGNLAKIIETFNAGFLTFMIAQMMDFGKTARYLRQIFDDTFGRDFRKKIRDIKEEWNDFELILNTGTKFSNILKTAIAIGILAGSLYLLSKADPEGLARGFAALSGVMAEFTAAMSILLGIQISAGFGALAGLSVVMISLGIALGLIANSMVKLGALDMEQIVAGITGVAAAMVILIKGTKSLSSIEGKLTITAGQLILLAIALNLMALAVRQMGSMELEALGKGLAGLGAVLLELSLFVNKTNIQAGFAKTAAGLLILGAAMNLFAIAMRVIGAMDFDSMLVAVGGLGAVLLELALFSQIVAGGGKLAAVGAGLLLVGTSMLILAQVMKQMAQMDWESIGKGLVGIGGSLLAIGVASRLMPKNMPTIAVGIVLISLALQQIATAMGSLGGLSWEEIGKGLTVIGVAMLELGIAMAFMETAAPAAAAIAGLVGAFALFIPQLIALGQVPIPNLIVGMIALAAALALFAGTAVILAPLGPVLLAVAGALALFGVAMAGIGIGLTTLTAALASLGLTGAAAVAGIITFLKQLLEMLPFVFQQLGLAIVALVETLADSVSAIVKAVVTIVKGVLEAIRDLAPDIIDTVLELIQTLLDRIIEKGPALAKAGMTLLKMLLGGIRDNIGELVTLAFEIVIAFAESLVANLGTLVQAGIDLIVNTVEAMAAAIPEQAERLGAAAADLGIAIVEGVLRGLGGFASRIGAKLMEGAKAGLAKVKSVLGIASPSKVFRDEVGKQIMRGWEAGIDSNKQLPGKALVKTGKSALKVLKDSLKIHSPSVVFKEEVGRWIAEGIAEGIEESMSAEEAAKQKAQNIIDAFSKELNRASLSADIAKLEFDIWQAMYPDAADYQYYSQYLRYLDEAVRMEERRLKLAEDELEQTIEQFGYASDEAMDAQKRMLEIKKSYLELRQEMSSLDYEIETMDIREAQALAESAQALNDARLEVASSEYELWKAMNPKASDLEQAKRNVMYFNEQLELQDNKVQYLKTQLQETVAEFGAASKEALDAQNAYLKAQKEYYEIINNRENVITNYKEGSSLTDDETKAMQEAEQTIKDQESALASYERILRDLAETNEKYGFGWTVDEMETIARKQSGYNKETLDQARKLYKDLQERTKEGAEELEELIQDKFGAFREVFRNFGMDYGNALGDSLKQTLLNTVDQLQRQLKLKKAEVIGAITDEQGVVLNDPNKIIGSLNSAIAASQSDPKKVDTSYFSPSSGVSNISDKAGQYAGIVANISMTQNNTSPKSLNSSDIYNKTNSLFAQTVNKVATTAMGAIAGAVLPSISSSKSSNKVVRA